MTRVMVFPCVHCSAAMAVMDFKLLVFQDLKTNCVVGAGAVGVALSSWKAQRNWGQFIYAVRKNLSTKQVEKDKAPGKRKQNE